MPAPANSARSTRRSGLPNQPGTATARAQYAAITCNNSHPKPLAEDHVTNSGCKANANGIAEAGVAR